MRAIILERLKRIHGSDNLILHLMIGNRMWRFSTVRERIAFDRLLPSFPSGDATTLDGVVPLPSESTYDTRIDTFRNALD